MPVYYDEQRKSWYCKFYYEDYTGCRKQKLKRGFKLQREAKKWERDFLERQQGTPDMTCQSLYDIYIEDLSQRLKKSTIYARKNIFQTRILPHFKSKPINTITAADIRTWQNKQIADGLSKAYLNSIHSVFSSFFNYAMKYYGLNENPCRKAGSMGKATRSINFWTLEEYKNAIPYVSDQRAQMAIELLFFSGIRKGELLALHYKDLDFTNCCLNINKTIHFLEGQKLITEPKTDNSIRTVTIPPDVMAHLQNYTQKIYGIQPEERIFDFTSTLIRNHLDKAAKAAAVKKIRIHDLRHSHVSLLIELGFSAYLIAERIGDTVKMVNETYGHLYPSKHQEVAEKLNILVSN